MSLSYSLFKSSLRTSIIESIYNEVTSKTARYYHWLGKENSWTDFLSPFIPSSTFDVPGPPQNNFRYDLHVRRDILTAKSILPSDVSYIIPRINWVSGTTYDIYDDAYTDPITVAKSWAIELVVVPDDIIKYNFIYYRVNNNGKLGTNPPTHVSGTQLNGTAQLTYITRDTFAFSGATSLETAKFYVLTSEFNIYKCIDNNNNTPSIIMPTGTTPDALITNTTDNYKWKFMYTIPVSLRNKFLTPEWIPVMTALTNQFYNNGSISKFIIDNPGSGYSSDDVILVSGNGYIANNPYQIDRIEIIEGGSGYTETPSIVFSNPTVESPSKVTAAGIVTLTNGVVTSTQLDIGGYGYEQTPTITITGGASGFGDPVLFNTVWTRSLPVNINNVIKYAVPVTIGGVEYSQDIYYRVTAGSELGTNPPSHITGSATNGNATLLVIAKRALLKAVTVKTEAKLKPIIQNGQIKNVIVIDGGIGYTNATIEIKSSLPGQNNQYVSTGTGASITVDFSTGNIDTLQFDVEIGATGGTIETIKVVDAGSGYGTASVQVLGDGTGATAQAVITAGQLTEVIVTNTGQGYTWTDVVITGSGTGATARAIMSPADGHGFNAVKELNATSLMFYTSIAKDKNQGLVIGNDYRKAGLVRNIKQFNSDNLFIDPIGSGCVLIEGNFDPSKIQYDVLLQKEGYKNYRVVEFTNTQILLSVFNNFSLIVGDELKIMEGANTNYTFTVSKVTERTIDQFSGDLLYVSVREKFAPTDEQIITLRTVITI
jgi:hypothetical protein